MHETAKLTPTQKRENSPLSLKRENNHLSLWERVRVRVRVFPSS